MSLEKLVAHAIEGNAIAMQEAFEEEISIRVSAALEEKYKKMAKESDDEDESDEDEIEDESDEDEDEIEEGKKKK